MWRCLDENTGLSFHPYTQGIPEGRYRYTDLVRFHSAEIVLVDKEYPIGYTEWGYRDAWCSALGVDKGMLLKRILDVGEQDGVPIWLYSWDDPTGEGFGIEKRDYANGFLSHASGPVEPERIPWYCTVDR